MRSPHAPGNRVCACYVPHCAQPARARGFTDPLPEFIHCFEAWCDRHYHQMQGLMRQARDPQAPYHVKETPRNYFHIPLRGWGGWRKGSIYIEFRCQWPTRWIQVGSKRRRGLLYERGEGLEALWILPLDVLPFTRWKVISQQAFEDVWQTQRRQ